MSSTGRAARAVEVDDDDVLVDERGGADDRGEGDVGGVTSGGDAHEAVDRCHAGGVEQVPLTVEEGFEEAVEVGRVEVDGVARTRTGPGCRGPDRS